MVAQGVLELQVLVILALPRGEEVARLSQQLSMEVGEVDILKKPTWQTLSQKDSRFQLWWAQAERLSGVVMDILVAPAPPAASP